MYTDPHLSALTFKSIFSGVKKAVAKFDDARSKVVSAAQVVAPGPSAPPEPVPAALTPDVVAPESFIPKKTTPVWVYPAGIAAAFILFKALKRRR